MPPKSRNLPSRRVQVSPEPPVMTWGRALPPIVVGGIFDLVQLFFHFFWFLGPAAAALYCTISTAETLSKFTFGFLGAKTAGLVCSVAAGAIGAAGIEATAPFGVIMAGAVGFMAFLTLGLWVLVTNMRILKVVRTAPLQFAAAFMASEIPFVGALPMFSLILWRLYHNQIKAEGAAHAKWKEETAAARLQEQRQQMSLAASQAQAAQQEQMQFEQLQAANDATYEEVVSNQSEAANDDEYIPQKMDKAA